MSLEAEVEQVARAVSPEDLEGAFLHVVVFGPGHGEAVLVRMPDGRVGVVDGCGEPPQASDRGSPLFALIEDLGVTRLLFACVTHPHQDHFGGFARLIRKHPPEHLWWSGSRERKFFEHYRKWLAKRRRDEGEGDDEAPGLGLDRLVTAIEDVASSADARPRVQHLEDHKLLMAHPAPPGFVYVEGLLPSSSGVRAAERDALAVLDEGDLHDHKRLFDPNRISGALLLTWEQTRVLLGGDALHEGDPHAGWASLQSPLGRVHLVKVPHHASQGAHLEALWAEMAPDLAVVTCVQNARNNQPPRPDMLEKLLRGGSDLVLTSPPAWWSEERHALAGQPEGALRAPPKGSGNPALRKAWPRSAANKHENAVVIRLNERGRILRVQLHGDARRLHLRRAARR